MLDDVEVQAGKLAQVSRNGRYNFADAFHAKAESYAIQGLDPYIVAYASLQGLRYFNRVAAQNKTALQILVPSMIHNEENDMCGYKIDWSTGSPIVTLLPKDFQRSEHAVIFDETKNTGNVLKQMNDFWGKEGGSVAKIDCITDVSGRHAKDRQV